MRLPIPRATLVALLSASLAALAAGQAPPASQLPDEPIPLPEQPRPDFARPDWLNLNGHWRFAFDTKDVGVQGGWFRAPLAAPRQILVPFSWGAPLSGVPDSGDVAWYERTIRVPESWRGKRIFLVVGASDWRTSGWIDGTPIGEHQGGYTPFSFELTPNVHFGGDQRITLRVDDSPHPFKLEGKQGYGPARGLWQTVYLEARGSDPLDAVHFTPDIERDRVAVDARLHEPAPRDMELAVTVAGQPTVRQRIARGATTAHTVIAIPNAHRWSLDDPYLYDVDVVASAPGLVADSVRSYFGMRKISVVRLPGTTIPYVAINDKPVFLQLTLDQAYHPTGYYTFPTDSFTRGEILRARRIGLNGLREHIKIETPRKLYWADKLGVLIMADVPNWWGEPDSAAFAEHDYALRGMIDRDYNHPAIFSWILFNESWGLFSKVNGKDVYTPETQHRVAADYRLAKSLDSTRLVEDNSVCCHEPHTETDLNSWHNYLGGWQWEPLLDQISDSTYAGSTWNFAPGYRQASQPMLNSEFGDVWGYEGSTGDVDWSWEYHMAVNAFRRHPKVSGWLYTELHDVINEWNGYYRFDRSTKETGFGGIVPGMTLNDLHSPYYLALSPELVQTEQPGATVAIPLWASFLGDGAGLGDSLTIHAELYGWNAIGERKSWWAGDRRIALHPWSSDSLAPLTVTMPSEPAVVVLATRLESASGVVLQRNFTTFVVPGSAPAEMRLTDGRSARVAHVAAGSYSGAHWSQKTWTVLDGLKADGAGSGFFEYRLPWPTGLTPGAVSQAKFVVELSAKQLFGKDRDTTTREGGDYMRGGGLHDPSKNPNAYPMTDERKWPSAVSVWVNGELAGKYELPDDPADSRGILSWWSQKRDGHLREAGSYGRLLQVPIPTAALTKAAQTGSVVVRLEVSDADAGGLAVYGSKFGRYPVDPSVVFVLR